MPEGKHPDRPATLTGRAIVRTWTRDSIGNVVVTATALPVATPATDIADRSHRGLVANPRAVYRSRLESQAATQGSATIGTTAPSPRQRRDPMNRKYRTLQRQHGILNRSPRDLQRHSRDMNQKCATAIAPPETHQTTPATHSPPPETQIRSRCEVGSMPIRWKTLKNG